MKKLIENPKAKFRSVQGVMAETNLSRASLMQAAKEAGAVIRYGTRGLRINVEKLYAYWNQSSESMDRR